MLFLPLLIPRVLFHFMFQPTFTTPWIPSAKQLQNPPRLLYPNRLKFPTSLEFLQDKCLLPRYLEASLLSPLKRIHFLTNSATSSALPCVTCYSLHQQNIGVNIVCSSCFKQSSNYSHTLHAIVLVTVSTELNHRHYMLSMYYLQLESQIFNHFESHPLSSNLVVFMV